MKVTRWKSTLTPEQNWRWSKQNLYVKALKATSTLILNFRVNVAEDKTKRGNVQMKPYIHTLRAVSSWNKITHCSICLISNASLNTHTHPSQTNPHTQCTPSGLFVRLPTFSATEMRTCTIFFNQIDTSTMQAKRATLKEMRLRGEKAVTKHIFQENVWECSLIPDIAGVERVVQYTRTVAVRISHVSIRTDRIARQQGHTFCKVCFTVRKSHLIYFHGKSGHTRFVDPYGSNGSTTGVYGL